MSHISDAVRDLSIIAKQSELLQFIAFDPAIVWLLGKDIRSWPT